MFLIMLSYVNIRTSHLFANENFNPLQVVNIFNLFIAYGDTFLKKTSMYDELYYELNREEKIFSEIHACGKIFFQFTHIHPHHYLSFSILSASLHGNDRL